MWLRRGFVVRASAQALDSINALEQKYVPTIEEDMTVTTQDGGQ